MRTEKEIARIFKEGKTLDNQKMRGVWDSGFSGNIHKE